MLIADNGRLFGILTPAGRVLSSDRGNGYAAESWLRDDGDLAEPGRGLCARAAGSGASTGSRPRCRGSGKLVYVGQPGRGRRGGALRRGGDPDRAELARAAPEGRCLFVGRERLRRDGALAIRLTPDGLEVEGARSRNRARPGPAARGARPDARRRRAGRKWHAGSLTLKAVESNAYAKLTGIVSEALEVAEVACHFNRGSRKRTREAVERAAGQ